jgi:methyltransferase (TIGR00027 family)
MPGVADTAFLVAALRAAESARPDALVVDPLAARLAGEIGRAMLERVGDRAELAGWSVVMRTRIIDRFLEEAIGAGTATILSLGAGLDTRPYRMELPRSLSWIEVDRAAVIAHKSERLAGETPRCRVERVAVDLQDGAARRTLFARVLTGDAPALVLAEGLLPYFEEEDVAGLLDDLRSWESAQRIVVERIAPEVVHARNARSADDSVRMRFAPAGWAGFFASHGWRVKQMRELAHEGVRCGRPCPACESMSLAYALLERT